MTYCFADHRRALHRGTPSSWPYPPSSSWPSEPSNTSPRWVFVWMWSPARRGVFSTDEPPGECLVYHLKGPEVKSFWFSFHPVAHYLEDLVVKFVNHGLHLSMIMTLVQNPMPFSTEGDVRVKDLGRLHEIVEKSSKSGVAEPGLFFQKNVVQVSKFGDCSLAADQKTQWVSWWTHLPTTTASKCSVHLYIIICFPHHGSISFHLQICLLLQVEITVRLSQASSNLRDLIEGNKLDGIPAPPSQSLGCWGKGSQWFL